MAVFCIVLGSILIALFSLLGVGAAYCSTVMHVLGENLLYQFIMLPNELAAYLVIGGVGVFLGIVSGFPLIMHGIILRRLDAIEYLLACDVSDVQFDEDEPEPEDPVFHEAEDPDFDAPEPPEFAATPKQPAEVRKKPGQKKA